MSINHDIETLIARLPSIDPDSFTAKDLPGNGIAFFYEQREGQRIVYVDTHKADAGLYTRLRKHFGTRNSSRAWRRTSDLRLVVGGALLNRDQDPLIQEWADRQGERMREVESLVTDYLLSSFTVRALTVDNLEERLNLQRALIASLSAEPKISPEWLGHFAISSRIRESGLWNSEHAGPNAPLDLDRLSRLAANSTQSR